MLSSSDINVSESITALLCYYYLKKRIQDISGMNLMISRSFLISPHILQFIIRILTNT